MSDAKLKHLNDVSIGLLASSPAVSAYLQRERQKLLQSEKIGRQTRVAVASSDISPNCYCCGTVLVPGWSSKRPPGKRTRQDRLALQSSSGKAKQAQCERCHSINIIDARRKKRAPLSAKKEAPSTSPNSRLDANSPAFARPLTTKLDVSAGKKRSRTKRSSLHAMISSQAQTTSVAKAGFGLDLMDLLKS